MSLMMETFGMGVCQPTPTAALKEIAKQISDRDNSVRNAALNCIVTAYFLEGPHGDKVLKMVGQISDKDMSLLEERIKRAAKSRPVASVKPLPQVPVPRPAVAPAPAATLIPTYDDPEPEEEEEPLPALPPIQSPPPVEQQDFSNALWEMSPKMLQPHYDYESQHEEGYYNEDDIEKCILEDFIESCITEDDEDPPPVKHLDFSNALLEMSPILLQPHYEHHSQHEEGYYNEDDIEKCILEDDEEPRPVTGPYGLDQALLDSIETRPVSCSQPKLVEFDLNFLKEPNTHINPAHNLDTSMSMSPLAKMSNSMSLEWQLAQIGSRDIDKALDGTQHIETLLTSDQRNHLHQHEDLLVAQLVRNLEFLNQSNSPEVVNCYKRNLSVMVKFFGDNPELSCKVRESTLREAIKTLIHLLTEKRLEMLDPGTDMFVRVVNNVIIRILDRSDHTAIVCALVKNLYDTINNPGVSSHYQELLMKCIWKVIKFLDDWVDELQYDMIFVDIHAFLRDYPSSWWKKQPSDTPLRTIKTIMHTIVKLNGPCIGDVLKNVRGVTPESELWTYVQKLLKHIKCVDQDVGVAPAVDNREVSQQMKHSRMSKSTHDQLSEIFRKIGRKEETNEGMRLLYEFKQQYPEADINPHLQRSSKFFQDYIERGLKSIETDRRLAGESDVNKIEEDNDSGQYLQRLRAWQAKAGWNNIPAAATRPTPLSPPQAPMDSEPLPVRHSQLDISSDSISADETEVEALRRRLEKVRRSALR